MPGRSALIFGATGATGKHLLTELLVSKEFDKVTEVGRRVTSQESLGAGKEKLVQKTVDFEKIGEAGLSEGRWDVVFITLGTSRAAAGGAAGFEKIDREYVVNGAQAAKSTDPNHSQRLIYLSSAGASATSPFLYPKFVLIYHHNTATNAACRSKGLTENALSNLKYSDTLIFRPGLLVGRGDKEKLVEKAFGYFTGFMTKVAGNNYEITTELLAKAITRSGELGSASLPATIGAKVVEVGDGAKFTLIDNAGASKLGSS